MYIPVVSSCCCIAIVLLGPGGGGHDSYIVCLVTRCFVVIDDVGVCCMQ